MTDMARPPAAEHAIWVSVTWRTLIAVVLLIVVYVVFLVWMPYQREQRIVRVIEGLGGQVGYRYDGPAWVPKAVRTQVPAYNRVISVDLHYVPPRQFYIGREFRDAGLTAPSGAHLSDKAIAQLEGLTHLQSLNLNRQFFVTDAGVESLRRLTALQDLQLAATQVGDKGTTHLRGLVNLTNLDLSGTLITDAGLQNLTDLVHLTSLDLNHTKVTGSGMQSLANLTELKSLNLTKTRVDDAGLKHIARLPHLQMMDLRETKITDEGVEPLAGMPALRLLDLTLTKVTPEAADRIQQARPQCYVTVSQSRAWVESKARQRRASGTPAEL
jgi:hypothetical protein